MSYSFPPVLPLFLSFHAHIYFFLTHLRGGSRHPLIRHCVFPKNKDVLLRNHSALSKHRTFNTSIHSPCAVLSGTPKMASVAFFPPGQHPGEGHCFTSLSDPSRPFNRTAFLCCMARLRMTGKGQACHRTAPRGFPRLLVVELGCVLWLDCCVCEVSFSDRHIWSCTSGETHGDMGLITWLKGCLISLLSQYPAPCDSWSI